MENSSIEALLKAYELAPSGALAKVIVLEMVGNDNAGATLPYLMAAQPDLSTAEVTEVAKALVTAGDYNAACNLLDTSDPAQALIAVSALHKSGQCAQAGKLYHDTIESDPGLQDEQLNALFPVSPEDSADRNRGRLRVVEKPDMAGVVNMDRYRAETTDFRDVVGLEAIKKQISKKIILPFQKPSLFARFRKKIGGGVLLFGPPGCGKTLLARATAGECNASFFNIEISDVLDMYIGESERKLHDIFEKARSETPSVIFFDEIEALAGKREYSRNSSSNNVISQMLTELDGFAQNNSNVLILASTNVPWAIDPAFLRPGRFDRMFFVPPPDKIARAGILEHHMKDRPSARGIDYALLAAKTSGFSGADLSNLVEMAADEAIDESIASGAEVLISFQHFKDALTQSRSTTVEWLTTARNYARYANDGGRYNDVIDFLKKHGN
jgi:AAA+ superfamily predicted ATPase